MRENWIFPYLFLIVQKAQIGLFLFAGSGHKVASFVPNHLSSSERGQQGLTATGYNHLIVFTDNSQSRDLNIVLLLVKVILWLSQRQATSDTNHKEATLDFCSS